MSYFILGIHTGIGKTIASLFLAQKLGYKYWKPIQSGTPTDSEFIASNGVEVLPEKYLFKTPVSPHFAAEIENQEIKLEEFIAPEKTIIESAGGILSPLNQTQTNFDLALQLKVPVVLVVANYLGSINHSLLAIEKIKNSSLDFKGIIISGDASEHSEKYILRGNHLIARIPTLDFDNVEVDL